MLSDNLRKLISNPKKFLEEKYPDREKNSEEKEKYEKLLLKFSNAESLLQDPKDRKIRLTVLCKYLNTEVLKLYKLGKLSSFEKNEIEQYPGYDNADINDSLIKSRQVQRFYESDESSSLRDLQILFMYLEIPFSDWDKYFRNGTINKVDAFNKKNTINISRRKELSNVKDSTNIYNITGSWNLYIYEPENKNVYQLPVFLEKDENNNFTFYVNWINNELFEGPINFYEDYLVCTLTNEKRVKAINLQTYASKTILNQKYPILNTACIWIQLNGKPLLSILILYKSKKRYVKTELPSSKLVEISIRNEFYLETVNHFIEYLSRKGEPELAARWFKPNKLEEVKNRNATKTITKNDTRPFREDFENLKEFFKSYNNQGQWLSFSRIHEDLNSRNKRVSVFKWFFDINLKSRSIEVTRTTGTREDRTYKGTIHYKQKHVSIYFTSDEGYKHFLCPLPLPNVINE